MREDLLKLIEANNSEENGLRIAIPIDAYVDKMLSNATIVPYYCSGDIKGMIGYYNNDESKEQSFLTLILIAKDYQGKGLGKLLLQLSIDDLKQKGFSNYGLEVLKKNSKAIKLYEDFGFEKKEDRNDFWQMNKKLL